MIMVIIIICNDITIIIIIVVVVIIIITIIIIEVTSFLHGPEACCSTCHACRDTCKFAVCISWTVTLPGVVTAVMHMTMQGRAHMRQAQKAGSELARWRDTDMDGPASPSSVASHAAGTSPHLIAHLSLLHSPIVRYQHVVD